uniref:Uncharacterized protein n=1 Tax=uncultured Armatimonadetes bacterium TaxID=157466 RepID=A0A6J4JSG7_9BACT|nr:hypothetical protein AVDCRST_MAG63-4007 [uncultured Armatimonadetes bacterium]
MPDYQDERHADDFEVPTVPTSAFCLRVPGTNGEELVVHRDPESNEDFVFLFEAGDDAADYAKAAARALGFTPEIGRVKVRDLHFRTARFKPGVGAQVDLPLSR